MFDCFEYGKTVWTNSLPFVNASVTDGDADEADLVTARDPHEIVFLLRIRK